MAQKIVDIPGIGEVILAKRRGSKNLRLTIQPNGKVRVGLPHWAPYSTAIKFALNRSDWINQNLMQYPSTVLRDGDLIGKTHYLKFLVSRQPGAAVRTRLSGSRIIVSSQLDTAEVLIQKRAVKACERALLKESKDLLEKRLAEVAVEHGYQYKRLQIKRLTSRWGSCSADGVITLNYFLIQLPWHLIDYVIAHELIHTKHHNHSPAFWREFEDILPHVKELRKEIKLYRPMLLPDSADMR